MNISVAFVYMYLPPESRVNFDRVELCVGLAEHIVDRLAFMTTSDKLHDLFIHILPVELGGYLLIGFVPTKVATCM